MPQCLFVSPGEQMPPTQASSAIQFEEVDSLVGRLGALSHEMRAVLLLGMVVREPVPHTTTEARTLLQSMLPEGEHIGAKNTTKNHLAGQLAHADLVTVEQRGQGPVFSATPEALRALPLASFLLQYGEAYDRSMISLTGKPSSRIGMEDPVRSRLTTLRFVTERLGNGDRMMSGDLNELLKAKNAAVGRDMLLWLANQGFFAFDHWAISDDVAFRAGENIAAPLGAGAGGAQRVVQEAFRAQDRHTFTELEEILAEQGLYDPALAGNTKNLRSLLLDMVGRGQLDKTSGRYGDGEIIVACDDTQHTAMQTLVRGLDMFANGNKVFIDEHGKQALGIANKPDSLAAALARVRRAGGKMTPDEGEHTREAVLLALDRIGGDGAVCLTKIVEDIAKPGLDTRVVGRLAARRALERLSRDDSVRITETPQGYLYERVPAQTRLSGE